jgi:hypothetical protein
MNIIAKSRKFVNNVLELGVKHSSLVLSAKYAKKCS